MVWKFRKVALDIVHRLAPTSRWPQRRNIPIGVHECKKANSKVPINPYHELVIRISRGQKLPIQAMNLSQVPVIRTGQECINERIGVFRGSEQLRMLIVLQAVPRFSTNAQG